jgi:DNA-binding NarL/FixJ family response regulator
MEVRFSLGLREPILGNGIKQIINRRSGFSAFSVSESFSDLVIDIEQNKTNFVIIDGELPSFKGEEDIELIRSINPDVKIALICESPGTVIVKKYLEMGFDGLLLTCCHEDEVLKAIDQILEGRVFVCSSIKRFKKSHEEKLKELHISEREIEIMKEMYYGYSSKDISENLDLSYHTVVTHRKNIFKKFEVKSAIEMMRKIDDLDLHLFC